MASAPIFSGLSSDLLTIARGEVLFQERGSSHLINLGEVDVLTIEPSVEEVKRYSKRSGLKTLIKSAVTSIEWTLNMTLVQFSDFARAASVMGDIGTMSQSAATNQTKAFADVLVGGIYEIDAYDLSNVTVTDGEATPVSYVSGTHYRLDAKAGLIELIAKPAGAGTDIEVKFDQAAIVSGDKRLQTVISANSGIEGKLIIRGTGDIGVKEYIVLPYVELRPSGARSFIGEDDFGVIELTGSLMADATFQTPDGVDAPYGYATTL